MVVDCFHNCLVLWRIVPRDIKVWTLQNSLDMRVVYLELVEYGAVEVGQHIIHVYKNRLHGYIILNASLFGLLAIN